MTDWLAVNTADSGWFEGWSFSLNPGMRSFSMHVLADNLDTNDVCPSYEHPARSRCLVQTNVLHFGARIPLGFADIYLIQRLHLLKLRALCAPKLDYYDQTVDLLKQFLGPTRLSTLGCGKRFGADPLERKN
jgi:hypothetical protein